MIEQTFQLYKGNEKKVTKLVKRDNVNYIHMVFPKGEGLPLHISNAELFMTVVRGTLSLGLDNQEIIEYQERTVINIPYQVKMNVRNENEEVLELIVVKIVPKGKLKI